MTTVWSYDWKARISRRLESQGVASVRDLLRAKDGKSYEEVAAELGGDIAPAQLVILHLQQCADEGSFVEGAADCLARALVSQLQQGWGRGFRVEYRTASAFAEWLADVSHTDQSEMSAGTLELVKKSLRDEVKPPEGWLPKNGRDALIQEAFRLAQAKGPSSHGETGVEQ